MFSPETFSLPTTKNFVWKFRDIFLSNVEPEHLQTFVVKKKQKLLSALHSNELDIQTENLLTHLPKPSGMKDISIAAKRILSALKRNEKITIFGDYDVDGTTSCAMLHEFFESLNYSVDIYIPDRLTEGYGLNPIGLKKCVENGASLIITVDNGIASVSACALAKELKVDVIITDHHDLPPQLPNAFAILNPKQPDCSFGFPTLAGVGVAFYLMIAIRAQLKQEKPELNLNLKYFLDYVAIGTIADMAALTDINHILCKTGLDVLNQNLTEKKRPGLYELLKLAGWDEESAVTATDIGFKIGPRLNASGRLGNALHSVSLLKSKNTDEAIACAEFLHQENSNRQVLEKKMTSEALIMAEEAVQHHKHAIVLQKDSWHPGVVGLVASRVLEKYYKPTIILGMSDGRFKGSGRSTHAFDLFSVLNSVRNEFVSFGGHYHAVGMTLEQSKFKWFQDYLNLQAERLIPDSDSKPILFIDGVLPIVKLKMEFLKHLESLEPFGQANPSPRWLIGPAQVRNTHRIGKDLTQGHAKVTLVDASGSCVLTVFQKANAFEQFLENGLDIYLVVGLKKKVWNSKVYLDIIVADFAPIVYLQ